MLETLLKHRHPVTLVTKSALILRDLDVLTALAEHRLVRVMISLTSLDRELKRTLEPRTASPEARLKVIRTLAEAGVPVGTLISPVIPGLTDHELERLLEAARDAGASSASWMLLRLPREVAPLFEDWLSTHYPQRADKVMSLMRQCRGGVDYDARFGHRMRGEGVFAELLAQRFDRCHRRWAFQATLPWIPRPFSHPARRATCSRLESRFRLAGPQRASTTKATAVASSCSLSRGWARASGSSASAARRRDRMWSSPLSKAAAKSCSWLKRW